MAKKKSKTPKSNFQYATPTVGISLIAFGFILQWGLPVLIGFILGLVWMFRYSKGRPYLRLLWWLILVLIVALEISISVIDIHKFF
jgi:hypothetical protein